jgi:hypothetical protein
VRRLGAIAFVLAVAVLVAATSAHADTTLGSKLEDPYETTFGASAGITVYQEASSSELLTAPGPGTITAWKVRSGDLGAKYELRILRASGGGFSRVATSSAQTVTDAEDKVRGPFAVALPVKAGDRIGLYVLAGAGAPINNVTAPLADELDYIADPFNEGETKEAALTPPLGNSQELLLQASFSPGKPVELTPPTISGEARAGIRLTATEGSWEGASTFAYQWLRCSGAVCTAIAGATSPSFTPGAGEEGLQLRLDVTAAGEGGKTTASSSLTDGVKPAPPAAAVSTGPPVLSGEARETQTLTGTVGNWSGSPTSFAYQWLRCAGAAGTGCVPVAGAISPAYLLTHADAGSTMRLEVTASNAIGPGTALSAPSAVVQALAIRAQLAVSPGPTCVGVPTTFDASGSQTPNLPITRYRLTYKEVPWLWVGLAEQAGLTQDAYLAKLPVQVLAVGPQPIKTTTFTWNRPWTAGIDYGDQEVAHPGVYVRDALLVTLEVTDLAGATAGTTQWVFFSSYTTQYSGELALGGACPKVSNVVKNSRYPLAEGHTIVSKTRLVSTLRCATATPCAGTVSTLYARSLHPAAASSVGAKGKATVIAADPFFTIPGHHTATVTQKLTKAGRALLRRGTPLKAIERLTSIAVSGKATTRSLHLTLRRSRAR